MQGLGSAPRRPDTKIILLAIGVVVVVVGAALGAYLALSGGDGNSSGPSDATATRQTADKVYTALNAHDETALKSLSCNPSGSVLGSIAGTLGSVREARPTSGERVSGHDATSAGTMLVSGSADPSARQTRVLFQLHLQKHGSRWCYAGLDPGTYAPAGPAPSSAASTAAPTAAPSGTSACDAVVQVQVIAHLLSTPEPTSDAPESFVPPTVGRRVATCVSRFRATGHRAHMIVWTGALMQQYVSQLKQLQWQVVGASAAAPVLQNGLGVRVTVVHDGALLVILLDEGH